jgi:nucleotide-binding universal stress UspA family protein
VAVKKALELSDGNAKIHLVHVQSRMLSQLSPATYRYLSKPFGGARVDLDKKLADWKLTIEEFRPDIQVTTHTVFEGSVQKGIERTARQIGADLIITGKSSHHSWFPLLNTIIPARMAKRTGIPVLTVKPGSMYTKIRSVVIPITSRGIGQKLELIEAICKKFRVNIHLVLFKDGDADATRKLANELISAYQRLKSNTHCPVEYAVLSGTNKAKATLQYAESINADVLLLHPETETNIGWLNKQISDVLPPASKMQVLTVQPAT